MTVAGGLVVSPRGRVRVRLGPVMMEWRVARVKPARPPDVAPAGGWGPVDDGNGLPGYGQRGPGGEVLHWRPLPRGVCGGVWPRATEVAEDG